MISKQWSGTRQQTYLSVFVNSGKDKLDTWHCTHKRIQAPINTEEEEESGTGKDKHYYSFLIHVHISTNRKFNFSTFLMPFWNNKQKFKSVKLKTNKKINYFTFSKIMLIIIIKKKIKIIIEIKG